MEAQILELIPPDKIFINQHCDRTKTVLIIYEFPTI